MPEGYRWHIDCIQTVKPQRSPLDEVLNFAINNWFKIGGTFMKNRSVSRNFLLTAIAALLLAVVVPSAAQAQGRGQGRGRGNADWSNRVDSNGDWSNRVERGRDWSDRNDKNRSNRGWRGTSSNLPNYNKKCGKFVNCHDARDGRIDGRGPRGDRVGNVVWRNRLRNRNTNNVWRNRTQRNLRRVTDNR
jgi:hypothetical protein